VRTNKSLKHGGGGDSNGPPNMVGYMITTYRADPKKIFVTGSSSGGIMTNVLSAVCPDVTATASAYPRLAAGRLAGSPSYSQVTTKPDCANSEKLPKVKKLG
jgi:acetylxylan esterase